MRITPAHESTVESDSRLLAALPLAALEVDVDGCVLIANEQALVLLGLSLPDLRGQPVVSTLFAEPEQGAAAEVLGQVLGGGQWQGELPMVGADGSPRLGSLAVTALYDDDQVSGVLLVVEEVVGSRGRAQRLADRLTRLARVTAELLSADDADTVTGIVTGHMADAAGATVASLSALIDEDRLRLIGIRGGRAGVRHRWETYDVANTPAGDCVTSRKSLVLSGREEIHSRYPELEKAADGERSIVCLPLLIGKRAIGVATMSFPGRRTFSNAELEFFRLMADTCAQALDRVQALADAADQASKLQFLADVTAELASSLDYEGTLRNVAQMAVPWFADWCAISLGVDGVLRTLAVAHVDPGKVALAQEFQERFPSDPNAPRGSYQVFRSGQSELMPEITDEMLAAAISDPEQLALVRQLNFRSAMSVPLAVNDKVLGVVTWVAGEEGRRFTLQDLVFGEDLARRAAVAIDNAGLHTELGEIAVRLQRAVLPTGMPVVAGWEIAAHYSPAGHLDAGGDFYDVVPLGAERMAVIIGDVMGRGVHAAAAMAHMRSAILALVAIDPEPKAVLTRLDTVFEHYDLEQLVTMVYAVVDPGKNEVTVANAGHLPPVMVRADGRVELLPLPDGVLLGAGGSERTSLTSPFAPGDALLAFTDGLIERRDEDIDIGQQRLLDASRDLGIAALPAALEDLVKAVSDPARDDDIAVLLLRRAAEPTQPSGSGETHR